MQRVFLPNGTVCGFPRTGDMTFAARLESSKLNADGEFFVNRLRSVLVNAVVVFLALCSCVAGAQTARWSEEKANHWYAQQPWLVGSNYTPQSAVNELEMWQEATFDPAEIDRELGWAEALGMNAMRVFLHDLLWQQDAPGFRRRIDQLSVS